MLEMGFRTGSSGSEFPPIRHRTDAHSLFELAGKSGLVGVTARQGDLGDGFASAGKAMARGIDSDLDQVLSGGDVEQRADALVELIDGKPGHLREGGQPQGFVIVAVDVVDHAGQRGEFLTLFTRGLEIA